MKLNVDKCKVQCSVEAPRQSKSMSIDGEEFPIVSPFEGFSLLGTKFTLKGGTREEVKTRIRIAWRKFHQIWPLLKHRGSGLLQRIRLFNAVVGRSLLWGCESWTLSVAEKQKLRAVERSMLRKYRRIMGLLGEACNPDRNRQSELCWCKELGPATFGDKVAMGMACCSHGTLSAR